jgi:hypothetical protein
MQWKHPSSPVVKKFKTQASAGKLMLTIFWDSQGPILDTYLERGTTFTSATYCDMLQRGLKPAMQSKRRRETVRRGPVVARQCPSSYCGPHFGNRQEIEEESHGTYSSQSRFGAI